MSDKALVASFRNGIPDLNMTAADRARAVRSASWARDGVGNVSWSNDDARNMALYVLWAHQRILAVEELVSGQYVESNKPPEI